MTQLMKDLLNENRPIYAVTVAAINHARHIYTGDYMRENENEKITLSALRNILSNRVRYKLKK